MNAKIAAPAASGISAADIAKLLAASLVLAGTLFAFYWFRDEWPFYARVPMLVAGAVVALAIAAASSVGRTSRHFLSEALIELRKVVWPTRQETVQLTVVVLILVSILSLILWAIDSLLALIVRALL